MAWCLLKHRDKFTFFLPLPLTYFLAPCTVAETSKLQWSTSVSFSWKGQRRCE